MIEGNYTDAKIEQELTRVGLEKRPVEPPKKEWLCPAHKDKPHPTCRGCNWPF